MLKKLQVHREEVFKAATAEACKKFGNLPDPNAFIC